MLSDELKSPNGEAALDPVVRQAIEWEIRIRGKDLAPGERDRFDGWRRADPAHEHAWARLQGRLSKLDALQSASGPAVRHALHEPSHNRRRLLKAGVGAAAVALAGIGTRRLVKVYSLDADFHNSSASPERTVLASGTPLTLGAGARVYAQPDRAAGELYLASGQIVTGNSVASQRQIAVSTRDGMVRTAGARLSVEVLSLHTVVAVKGGNALLSAHDGARIQAVDGSVWSISSGRTTPMPETSDDIFSWTRGTLVVLDRAVPDVLETLGRYFRGYIQFPERVLSRRVSGVFHLNDVEAALRQLAETLELALHLYGGAVAVAS